VIAIDGTKVHANASHHSNVDYEQLAREILKEAGEIDAAEDTLYGQGRGDELPEHLRTREGRRAALRAAKEKLARGRAGREGAQSETAGEVEVAKPRSSLTRMSSWPALRAARAGCVRLATNSMSTAVRKRSRSSVRVRSGYWRRSAG
jgi:hypothetical protein